MAQANKQTATLALLGSTGKTGREVLRSLLAKGVYNLHIYVRSKEKLDALFPGIETNPNVKLFVGSVEDHDNMQKCLYGVSIIICTLGSNEFEETTILRDSASSILLALEALRQRDTSWQKPRMIYLSSSTLNKRFAAARPAFVHWLISTAFQFGYADLKAAMSLLLEKPSLVSVLSVQPGVLVEETGTGYEISSTSVRLAAAYEDLGRACVELALERGYDALDEVGVSSKGGDRAARYAPTIFNRISMGLLCVYIPGALAVSRILSGTW